MESKEVFIDIDQLVPDGLQPRKVFDDKDIDDLAQDINTNGLHEGIDINPLLDGRETRYTIIDGERRYRAIQLILDYGQVKCNLYAYKSQKDIDDHRASKEFHKTKWPPVNRAEFLEYYMGTHKVRKQDLARRFSRSHTTIGRWLAPAKHKDILNALRNDRIGFSQSVALAEIDSAETRENALRDVAVPKGEKKTTLEEVVKKIALLVQNSKGEIKTSTEIQVKEGALPEENGETTHELPDPSGKSSSETPELTVEDKAAEFASPVVDSETVGEEGHSPQQDATPLTSSSTPDDIISKGFAQAGEKGTEGEPPEEDEEPEEEEATDDEDKDKKLEVEEKKKEPPVCAQAGQVEEMLQKFVKIPPKTFLARFKTPSHKGNFKNRVEGIHLWSGELSDLMESDLNGDSLFVCEVLRKRKALMDILARPKHSIIESEREKFHDLMNELKTKIEQDAMSRR